ncbi:ribokinase [Chloroflexia bacterium SDU3-3]|nr:ribokinase [Chloroflexia bacterium SDU3-3]
MSIVVFGSINMDLVASVARLPQAGETLSGSGFASVPGGKGANQAVACARLGVPTAFVGKLGADSFGHELRRGLEREGVGVTGLGTAADLPSGIAVITVDARGENTIVVVPGANGAVGEAELDALERQLAGAKVLLLQLEVPLAAVEAAAAAARERGVLVVLDPAPAQPLPAALLRQVDIITPNETEAAALVGFALADDAAIARAAELLCERGAGGAIIKLGGRGAYVLAGGRGVWLPAFAVEAVDTVAAGDAFNGALAAALSLGMPLEEAARWGAAGGALATTRRGAQAAMPTRAELAALLG